MQKTIKQRRVSSKKLHSMFASLADEIANSTDRVVLSLKGNTIEIDLSDAIINISLQQKEGGQQ